MIYISLIFTYVLRPYLGGYLFYSLDSTFIEMQALSLGRLYHKGHLSNANVQGLNAVTF